MPLVSLQCITNCDLRHSSSILYLHNVKTFYLKYPFTISQKSTFLSTMYQPSIIHLHYVNKPLTSSQQSTYPTSINHSPHPNNPLTLSSSTPPPASDLIIYTKPMTWFSSTNFSMTVSISSFSPTPGVSTRTNPV